MKINTYWLAQAAMATKQIYMVYIELRRPAYKGKIDAKIGGNRKYGYTHLI